MSDMRLFRLEAERINELHVLPTLLVHGLRRPYNFEEEGAIDSLYHRRKQSEVGLIVAYVRISGGERSYIGPGELQNGHV